MTRHFLPSLLVMSCALLSACSILPKSEALDIYQLPTKVAVANTSQAGVSWSLRVSKPLASQLLDSTRIAVLPEGDRISAYKGVRWSDRAPVLLRDRLIEAFLQDGRMAAVSSDTSRLQSDLELVTDLRAFQSEYRDGQPQVHLVLDAKLVSGGTQRILVSQRFDVRQASADASVPAVVRAFGQAADQLSEQVVQWSLRQSERLPRP
ncbi:ABC-type transport auxiliary lipoprotein family protein [Aquipseudomonas campi]